MSLDLEPLKKAMGEATPGHPWSVGAEWIPQLVEEVERLRSVIADARKAMIGDKDDTPTYGLPERAGACMTILRESL